MRPGAEAERQAGKTDSPETKQKTMSLPILISIAVFVGVAALVIALGYFFTGREERRIEDRLELLAGVRSPQAQEQQQSIVKETLLGEEAKSWLHQFLADRLNLGLLMEQADVQMPVGQFVLFLLGAGLAGGGAGFFIGKSLFWVLVVGVLGATLPVFWLLFRRKRRLKAFSAQLPDALELIARALRAGQSLAAAIHLVGEEMPAPISQEFALAYEEQNLGIPLEESLRNMTRRVPNLDLKFFATAVVLQRQTGGDLAEVLDKISSLIRERFKIWGQIQALTGEGRMSGVVLMALPPVLLAVMYYLNPGYTSLLFEHPQGQKMLAGAVFMQLLGALTIRKIVNIDV